MSQSRRRELILDVSDVREIRKGTALLFATSTRPALLRLKPWYRTRDAEAIAAEQRAEEAGIAERAGRRLAM
ncbi:hypothetical protein [Marinitenerispora sediminis]|uniref:Uncharacterized protein n=1 Tax=Marinitenerispora sediminis TaxID=1931232 RepID=A0A368T3Q6_9ACTN|nr:hypothetical protein [Marinitenerispora sediminis]RCV54853.1 hypothetical protein DEF28_07090 [Marinitenerispora sediminis]RCV57391.1 hypothetical protein DEF24_15205 [Marinitenerispora sediminis]RCV60254.1 hypothetical protein DEF23_05005 [Marinitenerispora sediminis]